MRLSGSGVRAGLPRSNSARLIGLPPDADYTLAVLAGAPEPHALAVTADELAALALAHRPELRERQLDERIAVHEVRKAMLRLLPGLELRAAPVKAWLARRAHWHTPLHADLRFLGSIRSNAGSPN